MANAEPALAKLRRKLPEAALEEMGSVAPLLPAWLARPVHDVAGGP